MNEKIINDIDNDGVVIVIDNGETCLQLATAMGGRVIEHGEDLSITNRLTVVNVTNTFTEEGKEFYESVVSGGLKAAIEDLKKQLAPSVAISIYIDNVSSIPRALKACMELEGVKIVFMARVPSDYEGLVSCPVLRVTQLRTKNDVEINSSTGEVMFYRPSRSLAKLLGYSSTVSSMELCNL
jgi:hypothetical protein